MTIFYPFTIDEYHELSDFHSTNVSITGGQSGRYLTFMKMGNLVIVDGMNFNFIKCVAGQTDVIGTVPVGYRPISSSNIQISSTSTSVTTFQWNIRSNGNIDGYNYNSAISSTTNCRTWGAYFII